MWSISSTFSKQLLQVQIPKVQKRQSSSVFFEILGSAFVKTAHEMLGKSTPEQAGLNPIILCVLKGLVCVTSLM